MDNDDEDNVPVGPFFRRATDRMFHRRLNAFDSRLDKIENRLNYVFGGLAVLIFLIGILVPIIEKELTK